MKERIAPPTLDDYWAQLAPCLKQFMPDERRAALALYRELAKGQAVEVEQLAGALGMSSAEARGLLERVPLKAFAYWDDAGRVVGYGGLSVKPMHHRFEVDGRTLSTWCAWDGLFIPGILQRPARIASQDPENGETVRLLVTPDGVEAVEPRSAVISFIHPDAQVFGTSATNVMARFCHFIFFFSTRESGQRWVARNPATFLYPLDSAFALAKRANARGHDCC